MPYPSPPVAQASAHVFISGKVQGVGYRASACDAAKLLKIKGWVCNLQDGRVEATFEGTQANVDEIIQWCHHGPPTAVVEKVNATYQNVQGFTTFEMRHTPR